MAANARLSERISQITVSTTARVAGAAERLRSQGVDVVDFGAGEPDFPTPDNIKLAAIRALECNFTRYTATGGTQELREAICWRHRQDYGTDYQAEECAVTIGGKHAVFNLVQALVNPGDEVIIPVPYWVTYQDVVHYAGGQSVLVETAERDGFALTADMVARRVSPRTRLVILNSPCNPSGAVIPKEEFARILEVVAGAGAYLLTDECYCRFLYDGEPFSAAALPGARERVLVAGSLSKTYAMTGWRIGFTLAPAAIAQAVVKLQSHSTSNPNSIAQKAAVEALTGPQDSVAHMLAEYRRRRDFVVARLRRMPGVHCHEPQGAFYAYPNIGRTDTLAFAERLLEEARVAVVPGEAFGTHRHVRISYATSMGELERGLERFEKFLATL